MEIGTLDQYLALLTSTPEELSALVESLRNCGLAVEQELAPNQHVYAGYDHPSAPYTSVLDTYLRENAFDILQTPDLYRHLFDRTGVVMAIVDQQGCFLRVNDACNTFLGYQSEELLGQSFTTVTLKEDVATSFDKLRTLNDRRSESLSFEKRYITKQGNIVWGLVQISALSELPERAYLVQIQDITQRVFMQEQLNVQSNLLERITQNINEGIYRSEPGRGFVFVNDAFLRMFGYADLHTINTVGVNALYVDPSEKRRLRKKLHQHRSIQNEEIRLKTKAGKRFIGSLSSTLTVDYYGNSFLDGALRDITESKITRKKLVQLNSELITRNRELALQEQELATNNEELLNNQEQLRATLDELSNRNFELDQLLYKTSHDLRSPLSSILGLIQIMEVDSDPENLAQCLQRVRKSITKLDNFVKSMLDYGKANRHDALHEPIDFEALVAETLEGLRSDEYEGPLAHKMEVAQMKNTSFSSDLLLMKVLFSNIVSNALKYAAPYREAMLSIRVVHTTRGAFITFCDNGRGIEKKHVDRIFDMFYRASEESKGSGLGLYIVKQIIDKLQGTIELTSTYDVGTKIRIYLPAVY